MNDILSSFGLCRRAGKLIAGFNAVCDALLDQPKDIMVFVTRDISDKTKKEIIFHAGKHDVQVVLLPIETAEIHQLLHKAFAVLAVTDIKMAEMVKKKCS